MLRAAAADRNKGPILDILKLYLRAGMKLLEISSGTGQHVVFFAENFPQVTFQPSELDSRSIHSIVAHVDHHRHDNVRVPLFIDVTRSVDRWALPQDYGPHEVDVILNVNMIHISSNAAVEGLFSSAGQLLKENGLLIAYGPYSVHGKIFPQSNVNFDAGLRSQNSEWGLRDVDFLEKLGKTNGLHLSHRHEMPANNHMLVFVRTIHS